MILAVLAAVAVSAAPLPPDAPLAERERPSWLLEDLRRQREDASLTGPVVMTCVGLGMAKFGAMVLLLTPNDGSPGRIAGGAALAVGGLLLIDGLIFLSARVIQRQSLDEAIADLSFEAPVAYGR